MSSGQWPGPEPAHSGRAWASNMTIVLRAGPGHTFCGPGPGPGLIIQFASRARTGSAQLLRARAGPGPQIIFAGPTRYPTVCLGIQIALINGASSWHEYKLAFMNFRAFLQWAVSDQFLVPGDILCSMWQ